MIENKWAAIGIGIAIVFVLWLIAGVIKRKQPTNLSGVITSADGRLSLSRLQAFLWTMVLLASYCAAMLIHTRVTIPTADERTAAEARATAAAARVTAAEQAREQAQTALATAEMNVKVAQLTLDAADKASADAIKAAGDALKAATLARDKAKLAIAPAEASVKDARIAADAARSTLHAMTWVKIPAELLSLAGISLASGVFASVISANKDKGAPPRVTGVTYDPVKKTLIIAGSDFDTDGEVRIDGREATKIIDGWGAKKIIVALNPLPATFVLCVDTKGGKAAYQYDNGTLTQRLYREWADLFREDIDPRTFSVTKFQMFGWTAIAICFYIVIFCDALKPGIESLPIVDSTVVLLTGLSQLGYLGGKAAASPPK